MRWRWESRPFLDYLAANDQRAVAVGHHGQDVSEPVRKLVEDERAGFLDASGERRSSA